MDSPPASWQGRIWAPASSLLVDPLERKEADELAARAERCRAETAANEAAITALQQWYRMGPG
ncbi:hypothetical protein N9L68_02685 [bacterium]|nr:hypothetical protein [bacterium]